MSPEDGKAGALVERSEERRVVVVAGYVYDLQGRAARHDGMQMQA